MAPQPSNEIFRESLCTEAGLRYTQDPTNTRCFALMWLPLVLGISEVATQNSVCLRSATPFTILGTDGGMAIQKSSCVYLFVLLTFF